MCTVCPLCLRAAQPAAEQVYEIPGHRPPAPELFTVSQLPGKDPALIFRPRPCSLRLDE